MAGSAAGEERTPAPVRLRPATAADSPRLTALIRRAKASWNYPAAWLAEWAPLLEIPPAQIARDIVVVAEVPALRALPAVRAVPAVGPGPVAGTPDLAGVLALSADPEPEIAHLWIDPPWHRQGMGRLLIQRARQEARNRGWSSLRIESDPFARDFYERMGAVAVGEVAAPVGGEARVLPVLQLGV